MGEWVRAFNHLGIERFRGYLAEVRTGSAEGPPRDLLYEEDYTTELPVEVYIENKRFASRWGLGRYLNEILAPLSKMDVDGNVGLWSWLSLYLFDRVCPARPDGSRRPGQDYRHIADFSFRYRYRHLLYGPYAVYRLHHGHAIVLLAGPLHVENKIYHEVASRTELISNRGVVEASHMLYLDPNTGLPKRGAQDMRGKPGSIVRFIRVLQQLDLTYDIYGMSGKELIELFPPEFDGWRRQRSLVG